MNYYGRIVSKLNQLKISYCIARNYQTHPEYGGDLDLFVPVKDVQFVINVIKDVCGEFDCSMLLQSFQFSSFVAKSQKIFVFYILDKAGGKLHQIDLFMGFSLWGVCVIDSDTIVKNRVWDKNGFFKMDPNHELMIKYFQIQSYKSLHHNAKVEKYRAQLGDLLSDGRVIETTPYILELRDFFEKGKMPSFNQVLKNRILFIKEGIKNGNFSIMSRYIYKISTLLRIHKHIVFLNTQMNLADLHDMLRLVGDDGLYRKYHLTTKLGFLLSINKIINTAERGVFIFLVVNNKLDYAEATSEMIKDLVIKNLLKRSNILVE